VLCKLNIATTSLWRQQSQRFLVDARLMILVIALVRHVLD
jgi:hypothetical protein